MNQPNTMRPTSWNDSFEPFVVLLFRSFVCFDDRQSRYCSSIVLYCSYNTYSIVRTIIFGTKSWGKYCTRGNPPATQQINRRVDVIIRANRNILFCFLRQCPSNQSQQHGRTKRVERVESNHSSRSQRGSHASRCSARRTREKDGTNNNNNHHTTTSNDSVQKIRDDGMKFV